MRKKNDHGIIHAANVFQIVSLLAEKVGLSIGDKIKLQIAAILHDCGRKTNGTETKHGEAAIKIIADSQIIMDETVKKIIQFHSVSDSLAKKNLPEETLKLLWIFKDADALERIRTNDLDFSRIRNKEFLFFLPFAKKLRGIK